MKINMKDIETIGNDLKGYIMSHFEPVYIWANIDDQVEDILKIVGLLEETPINYPDDTK